MFKKKDEPVVVIKGLTTSIQKDRILKEMQEYIDQNL